MMNAKEINDLMETRLAAMRGRKRIQRPIRFLLPHIL